MNIYDRRGLRAAAEDALSCTGNAKRLVLIWAAVSAALPLLVSVLNFILDSQISQTGGLSGIGLRSTLSTVQTGLVYLMYLWMPFWNLGYTAAVMRFARREEAAPATLLEGFRRFGPALRLLLLKSFLLVILIFASSYAGITLLSLTPLADPIWALLDQGQEMLTTGVMDEAMLATAARDALPMFLICCGFCLVVVIPVFYRLRLADYCILDAAHRSGLMAMLESHKLMHRNRLHLFQLDLSFWWFYLAQVLLTALCYGDSILPALGITLPFSEDAAFFIFYIAALLAQFTLLYFCSNRVQTTYVMFYEALRTPAEEEKGLML